MDIVGNFSKVALVLFAVALAGQAYEQRIVSSEESTVSATITDKQESESTVTSGYGAQSSTIFYSVEYTVNIDGEYYSYYDTVDKDFYDSCLIGQDIFCMMTVNKHADGSTSYTIESK